MLKSHRWRNPLIEFTIRRVKETKQMDKILVRQSLAEDSVIVCGSDEWHALICQYEICVVAVG